MSNLWNLFSDQEDKYQNWLRTSAAPNIKSWYDKSGINERLQQAQTGLLGEQRWDPSGTKRVGGVVGEGGSLSTAGGQIKDYALGKERAISPPSTYGSAREEVARPGFKQSKMATDIHKGLDYGIEKFDQGVKIAVAKGNEWIDGKKEPVVNKVYKDKIMQGGKGGNVPKDLPWWQNLSGMFGSKFDGKAAMASWKEKGGFEGLMANPAFTMGLAFMQSAAEGKSLGSGALDNVMKAGGISSHYKQIIEDRKQEPIQATAGDIDEVKGLLKGLNIEEGNWAENLLGKWRGEHPQLEFDAAAEEIAVQFQKEVSDWQKNNLDAKGNPKIIRQTDKIKILKKLVDEGKIKKKESWLSKIGITAGTIRKPVNFAQGGQIQKGQPAIVGEGGPEYFLPQESGKIISNDDSRIFSMLLSANPQLQNVSRTRAEKILRNRFPDYFE